MGKTVIDSKPSYSRRLLTLQIILLSVFLLSLPVFAVPHQYADIPDSPYPLIRNLNRSDPLFRQLTEDILAFHRASAQSANLPPILFFSYITKEHDTLFSLAARLNVPYDTLALLNGIGRPEEVEQNMLMLIPNSIGLFVPYEPESDLEFIASSWRLEHDGGTEIVISHPNRREFRFFPNQRFHNVERAYFLGILFRFPLPKGVVTSRFGARPHPFTGERTFHRGIDIAAPMGTPIFASRSGIISDIGYDPVYGNQIRIDHGYGYETFYAHLETTSVELNQQIRSGTIIGTVGNTGASTGPHLHFEVLRRGDVRDPMLLLPPDTR